MGGSGSKQIFTYTVPQPGTGRPGESPAYRCENCPADLKPLHPFGATTLHDSFRHAASHFGRNQCLGTREVLPNNELGQYRWKNYQQVWDLTSRMADALESLVPRNEEGQGVLGLYSKNREEWMICDLAGSMQGLVSVPLYDTLGPDNLVFIVEQTQMRCVALSSTQKASLYKLAKTGRLSSISVLIQFEPVTEEDRKEAEEHSMSIHGYNELIAKFTGTGPKRPPSAEDTYTICYTSGTTGQSKGVVLTHRAMVSTMSAVAMRVRFADSDIHISYLPLAHIMERIIINYAFMCGSAVGFFGGNILKVKDDMAVLRPTIFLSVPRLFNRFYDAINTQFKAATGISRRLLDRGMRVKREYFDSQGTTNSKLWDTLVFRKVRNSIGGRVRILITGSAPISPEVVSFLKIVFSCPMVEGFGQTETCGASLTTEPDDSEPGHTGGPLGCVEIKLVAVPEMRYTEQDVDDQGRPTPRGELCFRGPALFNGYYKQPDKTAEAMDSEGWLHTGDIVMRIAHNGAIRVIDRKKNIFKLAQGEYVAVEKVEGCYQESHFINQIFVYGDSLKSYLVAIIVPDELYIRKSWCPENGIDANVAFEEICRNEQLKKAMMEDMGAMAKKKGLLGYEKVLRMHLDGKMWTSEDLLTPTQKLKRFDAKEKYAQVIEALYREGGD